MDVIQALEHIPQNETGRAELRSKLSAYINDLLLHHFDQLVQLLYHIDVSEQKLKKVLQENPEVNAGNLIADLLLKRQEEKLALRRSSPPANNIPDDERW